MDKDYLDDTPFIGDTYPADKNELQHGDDVNFVVESVSNVSDVSKQIDEINANVAALTEKFDGLKQIQDAQFDRLSSNLSFKACLPLYRLMIEYVDKIREMLRHQDHLLDMGESLEFRYNSLFESIEGLQEYIVEQLDNNQVEVFEDVVDNPLTKTERQEVVDCQVENNENEFLRYGEDVDSFYISSAPGYIYRSVSPSNDPMAQNEVVLRNEKVIKVVKGND